MDILKYLYGNNDALTIFNAFVVACFVIMMLGSALSKDGLMHRSWGKIDDYMPLILGLLMFVVLPLVAMMK